MRLFPLVALLIAGCSLSPHYRSEGPCRGFHRDPEACERAASNAATIGKVRIGQSLDDVMAIMGKGPERREAKAGLETWWYLTQYQNRMQTQIVFNQGLVTEIRQSR